MLWFSCGFFLTKNTKLSQRVILKKLWRLNKSIEVNIYTNEHAEVWVKSTIQDVRSKIEALRPYLKFMPVGNSKYILRSEISTNSIYIVFGTTDNNYWPELLHYEKWLESNNQVKENIAKYKEA